MLVKDALMLHQIPVKPLPLLFIIWVFISYFLLDMIDVGFILNSGECVSRR